MEQAPGVSEMRFCFNCREHVRMRRLSPGHVAECAKCGAEFSNDPLAKSPQLPTAQSSAKRQLRRHVIEEVENGWIVRITDTQDRVIAKYVYSRDQGESMIAFVRLSAIVTDAQIIKTTGVNRDR